MLIKVTKDTVKIVDEDYILNKGEYHVNTCYFAFSEEYTPDLVKKAIFVNDSIKKEMVISNNQCNIPYEVLVKDSFELRVYAYEIDENEELVLRYSPTHTIAYLREGSYVSGATAGEEITPTQFEQYQKALNDGLVEVNEKLGDVDTAITEANNLDAEVTKVAMRSTLSITKKDGSIQSVDILDGSDGNTGPSGKDGKDGADGITPTIGDNGNWYLGDTDTGKPSRGATGETGPAGADGHDGQNGQDGTNGADGFSPIASVSKSGSTATITITDKNGTTTATVSDGTNGTNGTNGQDGVGVPSGGTQGQILAKASATNYDTTWINAPDISGKLDTSKVKTSQSTTSGDVYDVTYINSVVGDIEALLGGI